MTSIKVKFKPSTVDIHCGWQGGRSLFPSIHNRVVRQLNTDYKVFAEEWGVDVVINGDRSNFLLGSQEVAIQKRLDQTQSY